VIARYFGCRWIHPLTNGQIGRTFAGASCQELVESVARELDQTLHHPGSIQIANLYADADPDGIVASAPGVGPVIHTGSRAGRDPRLLRTDPQGQPVRGIEDRVHHHQGRRPLPREMLLTAADQARKTDPQLVAKYLRLMAGERHHDSAIGHLSSSHPATHRIATCMRTNSPTSCATPTAPPPSLRPRAAPSSLSAPARTATPRQLPTPTDPRTPKGEQTTDPEQEVAERSTIPARQH